jgi:glycosyltransferase involved in cell wall biosynthesis
VPPGIHSAKTGSRPGFVPQRKPLEAIAGPRTRFVGYVDDHRLDALYRSHEALLFCGEEDFGIVPLEAIGRGCPVVAFARGGALETVEPGRSGVMFEEATVAAVIEAIGQARATAWDSNIMLASAQRFGARRFREAIGDWFACRSHAA